MYGVTHLDERRVTRKKILNICCMKIYMYVYILPIVTVSGILNLKCTYCLLCFMALDQPAIACTEQSQSLHCMCSKKCVYCIERCCSLIKCHSCVILILHLILIVRELIEPCQVDSILQ